MKYLNLETSKLSSEEFIGSPHRQQGAWLNLMRYCANQENRGVIHDCESWSEVKWLTVVGVERKTIVETSDLYYIEDGCLFVWGYPVEMEVQSKAKSIAGKLGGKGGINKEGMDMLKENLSLEELASLTEAQVAKLRHQSKITAEVIAKLLAELRGELSAELDRKCKGKSKSNGKGNGKCNGNGNQDVATAPAEASDSTDKKPNVVAGGAKEWNAPALDAVEEWARGWAEEKRLNPHKVVNAAREGWRYYERMDWVDSRGKKVKNWKLKIKSVWLGNDKIDELWKKKKSTGPGFDLIM